jgi:G3E family GTPase
MTKTDLMVTEPQRQDLARLLERLARLNPTARLLDHAEDWDAAHLLDAGLYNPATKTPDVARWLNAEALIEPDHGHHHAHRHDEAVRSFCLVSEAPLALSACDLFLEMLRAAHGPNLLRVKGVIALADDAQRPLVIHGVQHVFHPPVRLDAWPDSDHCTRIVFIVKDLDPRFIEGLYAAFSGEIRLDAPDAQALSGNPLNPRPGGLLA